jgi:hypothetical protein
LNNGQKQDSKNKSNSTLKLRFSNLKLTKKRMDIVKANRNAIARSVRQRESVASPDQTNRNSGSNLNTMQ